MSDTPDDEILEALLPRRRRRICDVLSSEDRQFLPLEHLAERVAELEDDRADPAEHVRTVTVELHHVHLPKLDDVGLLEFDSDAGAVHYEGDPFVEAVARGDLFADSARLRSDAE